MSEDAQIIDECIATLGKSYQLNRDNSAPLPRLAIMDLLNQRFIEAFKKFFKTQELLHTGVEKRNIEGDFLVVWCAIAQHHMNQTGLVKPKRALMYEDIDSIPSVVAASSAIFKRDNNDSVPERPLRCHTFDLQVIDRIFKGIGKPITDEGLRGIIDYWTSCVDSLDKE